LRTTPMFGSQRSMLPFSKVTARSDCEATQGSCVTRTTVRPFSMSVQKQSSQTDAAVFESKAEKMSSRRSRGVFE